VRAGVLHDDGEVIPISESALPVKLPRVESYEPTGTAESPLAGIKKWIDFKDPKTKKKLRRESNTMPQWAGSCWYYLRYLDPKNEKALVGKKKEKYWMSVDLYVGGAEHAVLHLLYARFWHKVLYDCGVVSTTEPFKRLVNQGMILGEDNQKMSKSRGNVVIPDDLIAEYGADSVRLYEMFMGPLEMVKPWKTKSVDGVSRFLGRAWRLVVSESENFEDRAPNAVESKVMHGTIKKVTDDVEGLKFHTAISAMMVFVNEFTKFNKCSKQALENFVLLLAPFAPHIAEELWQRLGHKNTLAYETWPSYDEKYLVESEVEIAIQVTGKIRTRMTIAKGISESEVKEKVLLDETVRKWTEGKTIRKFIVVPDRLVNIIV